MSFKVIHLDFVPNKVYNLVNKIVIERILSAIMIILFVFGSICIIIMLLKCIYNNIEKPSYEAPPPPTLEETLISLLTYFKDHIHQMAVYTDKVVIYCFKNTPNDNVSDFNEITIRYCDIGFKSIIEDDCKSLQEKLKSIIESS